MSGLLAAFSASLDKDEFFHFSTILIFAFSVMLARSNEKSVRRRLDPDDRKRSAMRWRDCKAAREGG
jgi:hypothetical protein